MCVVGVELLVHVTGYKKNRISFEKEGWGEYVSIRFVETVVGMERC